MALRMEEKKTPVVIVTCDKQGCAVAGVFRSILSITPLNVCSWHGEANRGSAGLDPTECQNAASLFFWSPTQHIMHVRVMFHKKVVVRSASL
jgi:hypothetical protein